ncbi:Putative HTH-type transcriptional regulatory protein [Actinoplanes sp. SE50]|uniref:helix-turn-helix domain-containing protein n=1 Tax=unclassified Actinoplanes TaxID=2626549 RepID=UPI00023ED2B3|nr:MULTISPECIES: helix-turn-helix domain-containing protein [unclassified Actinoplanes]AEV86669.1 Putative HTH-type transcriptional regulatory protein [Actinoplanes sp. SE50/110]ATO85067.1 Putative HTH-type transcriptional regulatory protein [Actinoplanes sp. SE50]SLM02478.1 XRE family transcriptional regulator [Actinoplanes sp. SE50/110]
MRTVLTDTRYGCAMSGATPGPTFGKLLTQGRTAKTWSQDRLAAETGISRTTISRYEREITSTPEAEHVRALCAALDIDPRRAAVSLGYLTADEIQPAVPVPAKLKEILDVLEDPNIPAADKQSWIDYLLYLKAKAQDSASAS